MYNIYHPTDGYGRLGNAIFRYLATILLCKKYDLSYINNYSNQPVSIINDTIFEKIFIKNEPYEINNNILLNDFYQFDLYLEYKNELLEFINKYKNIHTIKTDINDKYNTYNLNDIIDNKLVYKYDLVLHIRLEDFVNIGEYINVIHIINLLNSISFENINTSAIVVNKPKTNFEIQYINTLYDWFNKNNKKCVIESNDVITDFHIMKQSNTIICSKSTLSWCATLLSTTITKCYFPNYKKSRFQIFNRPHTNTIYYNIG
jgi:hypothetical protein